MSVQCYGHFRTFGSFAGISRAIVKTLQWHNIPVTIYDCANLNPSYEDIDARISMNNHSPVGLLVGYPVYPTNAVGWLQNHPFSIIVTVCESNRIPTEWVAICRQMSLTVVPSAFCLAAFQDSGVRNVMVVPHGVDDRILTQATKHDTLKPKGGVSTINLLHVSGATSFPQRKGTPQLLLAMREVVKEHPNVKLWLKTGQTPRLRETINKLKLDKNVKFVDGGWIHPSRAAWFFRLFDAVIQPSRGEGFGMAGLEAMCSGVPVIATNATGHQEWFQRNVTIEVKTSDWSPLATQGNDIGMCPSVSVGAIVEGIKEFLRSPTEHKERTQAWAETHAQEWSWRKVLKSLMDKIRPFAIAPTAHKMGEGLRGTKW